MDHKKANALAGELVGFVASGCQRVEIAGSLRRMKPQVNDLEIVAVPIVQMETNYNDMFGGDVEVNLLAGLLDDLYSRGEWALDQVVKRNGPKYKRLWHRDTGICCDLFITVENQWGNIFAIRTGPADFSQALVTRALQRGLQQDSGSLWLTHRDGTRTVIPCLEESDFFAALDVPYITPADRSVDALRKVLMVTP